MFSFQKEKDTFLKVNPLYTSYYFYLVLLLTLFVYICYCYRQKKNMSNKIIYIVDLMIVIFFKFSVFNRK